MLQRETTRKHYNGETWSGKYGGIGRIMRGSGTW